MGGPTSIEWTDHRWNPIVGCGVLSPGCTNCYAVPMAARIEAMNAALPSGHGGATHYAGTTRKVNGKAVWTGKLAMAGDDVPLAPLRRKKPTTYFVNSMGDLFHENCPDAWIDRVFAVMALCPQHTFQVLTKRAARMREYLTAARATAVGMAALDLTLSEHAKNPLSTVGAGIVLTGDIAHLKSWPLPNVWLGVSTEDQKRADERIPYLLETPAAVRFISAEPLLGPIDLTSIDTGLGDGSRVVIDALTGLAVCGDESITGLYGQPDHRLDWVICGGESGNGARPMHPDWARSLRDQCAAAGVAFFFKQWGAWAPGNWTDDGESFFLTPDDQSVRIPDLSDYERWKDRVHWFGANENGPGAVKVGKTAAGRLLDGVEHNGMPEVRA